MSVANFQRLVKDDPMELRVPGSSFSVDERFGTLAPWVAGAVTTLAALWLHFTLLLHGGALWRDEVNLVNLAATPDWSSLKQDSFPIAMPLAVRLWKASGLGGGDFGLRCLGALMGLGLLASFWRAAWLTRRAPPLFALAMVALNSTALLYGDSLRAYGLGSLFIVLALGATGQWLAKPSLGTMISMTVLMIASVQSLFHNAVLVGALCAGALAVCLARRAVRSAALVFLAGFSAALSLVPYLSTIRGALDPSAGWRTGFRPFFTWLDLRQAIAFPRDTYLWVWAFLLLASLIFAMRAAATLYVGCRKKNESFSPPLPSPPKEEQKEVPTPYGLERISRGEMPTAEARLFAGVTLGCGVVGFGGFLWCASLATQPWYFLPLMALAACCFDVAFAPHHRYLKLALAAFALGAALTAFPLARTAARQRFTNINVIAKVLTQEASPKDCVVVSPWYCGISFDRYYRGGVAWNTLPPLTDHRVHRFDAVNACMRNPRTIEPVLEKITATLRAGGQVWVVGCVEVPPQEQPPPASLPAPPLEHWGWSQTPYIFNWADQLQFLLKDHCARFEIVSLPCDDDINPYENLKLARASGWKTER